MNAAQQIGASGTYITKGYITAEEYSIDLQGKYGLQVYAVMINDSTVRVLIDVITNPLLGVEWFFEPASKDPIDEKIAKHATYEFFERQGHMDYWNIMREGFSFLPYGFFVGELVYDDDVQWNGQTYIGMKTVASRKQRSILRFKATINGQEVDGVEQILPTGMTGDGRSAATTAHIPRNKLLYVANNQQGENYFGESLLRPVYKNWKIKDGLDIMQAVALENMALGIPYIKKGINGVNVSEPELEKAREKIRQQRANEEGYWEFPVGVEVGFIDMKGHTTKDVMPTIEYHDRQILLRGLAQFLLLGSQDSAGSRAVSQDHSRLFVKAQEAMAKQWQTAWQRDVVNRWVDLNYSKASLKNGYPKFTHASISDEDVGETAKAVEALMGAGALHPDRDSENRMRHMLGWPELQDEDYEAYDENIAAKLANTNVTETIAGPPPIAGDVPAAQQVPPQPNPGNNNPVPPQPQPSQKRPANVQEAIKMARQAQQRLTMLALGG